MNRISLSNPYCKKTANSHLVSKDVDYPYRCFAVIPYFEVCVCCHTLNPSLGHS